MAFRGRGDVEANNIGGFGGKIRVVALAPGLASREVHLVAAQEAPDILDVNIAQRLGQYRAAPARKPLRRQLIQQLQNPLVGGLGRSAACPAAACLAALQGHDRHGGAAKG